MKGVVFRHMMYERVTSALEWHPPQISHEEMRKRQQLFCERLPTDAVAIITNNRFQFAVVTPIIVIVSIHISII